MDTNQWHQRYVQQSRWTAQIRDHLLSKVNLPLACQLLEVGCGTGAVLFDLENRWNNRVVGLDISQSYLQKASQTSSTKRLIQGDAHKLPFLEASFDLCCCHFLLLWVESALLVLAEMRRVTRPGGWVLALAEPDYGGRIDYPEKLTELADTQTLALQKQGADVNSGRKLASRFHNAGLESVQVGCIGGHWSASPNDQEMALEWAVIRNDMKHILDEYRLDEYEKVEAQAWTKGERILYVPTFWAIGRVPAT